MMVDYPRIAWLERNSFMGQRLNWDFPRDLGTQPQLVSAPRKAATGFTPSRGFVPVPVADAPTSHKLVAVVGTEKLLWFSRPSQSLMLHLESMHGENVPNPVIVIQNGIR